MLSTKKIDSLLGRLSFNLSVDERNLLLKRIRDGDNRYGYVVGARLENGEEVRRFLKVLVRNDFRTHKLFARQIFFTQFLKQSGALPTRGVLAYNINPLRGPRFAVFETYEKGDKIGFLDSFEEMRGLTENHARTCAKALHSFHNLNISQVSPKLRFVLQRSWGSFSRLRKFLKYYMKKKVVPVDTGKREVFEKVLSRRLNVDNFGQRASELLDNWESVVNDKRNEGRYFVHGDLAPVNLYVHDDGGIEFLDFEWVGVSSNKALALIKDYGNLRARSWNNRTFRKAMDEEMIRICSEENSKDFARAVVSLSILFSHSGLSSAFENYPAEKQQEKIQRERRESTENDLPVAWQIAGLELH